MPKIDTALAFVIPPDEEDEPRPVPDYQADNREEFLLRITSYREVMPEDLIQQIKSISDLTNLIRWKMGDAVNRVAAVLQRTGRGDLMDACWYVAVETGEFRSQNTLRGYAGTAAFYSRASRRMFRHDLLPFSHFAFAKQLSGSYVGPGGEKLAVWQVCLQYSLDYAMQHGHCTSEKKLREMFAEYEPQPTPTINVPGIIIPSAASPAPVAPATLPVLPDEDGEPSSLMTRLLSLTTAILDLLPLVGALLPEERSKAIREAAANLVSALKNGDA